LYPKHSDESLFLRSCSGRGAEQQQNSSLLLSSAAAVPVLLLSWPSPDTAPRRCSGPRSWRKGDAAWSADRGPCPAGIRAGAPLAPGAAPGPAAPPCRSCRVYFLLDFSHYGQFGYYLLVAEEGQVGRERVDLACAPTTLAGEVLVRQRLLVPGQSQVGQ